MVKKHAVLTTPLVDSNIVLAGGLRGGTLDLPGCVCHFSLFFSAQRASGYELLRQKNAFLHKIFHGQTPLPKRWEAIKRHGKPIGLKPARKAPALIFFIEGSAGEIRTPCHTLQMITRMLLDSVDSDCEMRAQLEAGAPLPGNDPHTLKENEHTNKTYTTYV